MRILQLAVIVLSVNVLIAGCEKNGTESDRTDKKITSIEFESDKSEEEFGRSAEFKSDTAYYDDYEDGNEVAGKEVTKVGPTPEPDEVKEVPTEVFLTVRNHTEDGENFRTFKKRNDETDLQASATDNLDGNETGNATAEQYLGWNSRSYRDARYPLELEDVQAVALPYQHTKIDTADLSDCARQGEWRPIGEIHIDSSQKNLQQEHDYLIPEGSINGQHHGFGLGHSGGFGGGFGVVDHDALSSFNSYTHNGPIQNSFSEFQKLTADAAQSGHGGFDLNQHLQKYVPGYVSSYNGVDFGGSGGAGASNDQYKHRPGSVHSYVSDFGKLPSNHKYNGGSLSSTGGGGGGGGGGGVRYYHGQAGLGLGSGGYKPRQPGSGGFGSGSFKYKPSGPPGGSGGYHFNRKPSSNILGDPFLSLPPKGQFPRGKKPSSGWKSQKTKGNFRRPNFGGYGTSVKTGGFLAGGGHGGYGGQGGHSDGSFFGGGSGGHGSAIFSGTISSGGHGSAAIGGDSYSHGAFASALTDPVEQVSGTVGGVDLLHGSSIGGLGDSAGSVSLTYGTADSSHTGAILNDGAGSSGTVLASYGGADHGAFLGGIGDYSGVISATYGSGDHSNGAFLGGGVGHGSSSSYGYGGTGGSLLAGYKGSADSIGIHSGSILDGGFGGVHGENIALASSAALAGSNTGQNVGHITHEAILQDASQLTSFTCGKNHDHGTNYHTASFQVSDDDHGSQDVLQYQDGAHVIIHAANNGFDDVLHAERKQDESEDSTSAASKESSLEIITGSTKGTGTNRYLEGGHNDENSGTTDQIEEPSSHSYYREGSKFPPTENAQIQFGLSSESNSEKPKIIRELENLSSRFQLDNVKSAFTKGLSYETYFADEVGAAKVKDTNPVIHNGFSVVNVKDYEINSKDRFKEYQNEGDVITEYPYYSVHHGQEGDGPEHYLPVVITEHHPPKEEKPKAHIPPKRKNPGKQYEVHENSGERQKPATEIFPPQKFPRQFHNPNPNLAGGLPLKPGGKKKYQYLTTYGTVPLQSPVVLKRLKKYKPAPGKVKYLRPVLVRRPVTETVRITAAPLVRVSVSS